jgi:hypothetical protein
VKYLLYLDAALAALGVAMSLCIGYVALVFVIYRDAAPDMRNGLHPVLVVAACCLALALIGSAAWYGLWKRHAWHWAAQLALVVLLPCAGLLIRTELAA